MKRTLRATVYIDVEVDQERIKKHKEIRKEIKRKLDHFLKDCKSLHNFSVCDIDGLIEEEQFVHKFNDTPRDKIYLEEYTVTLKPLGNKI